MRLAVLHNAGPGGALRFVAETSEGLAARGHEVTVCTWGDDADPPITGVRQITVPGRRIHLPPPLHPIGDLMRSVSGSKRAARWANDEGFDAAIVHPCRWSQAPAGLRDLRIPYIYYAHEGRRRALEPGYSSVMGRRGLMGRAWRAGAALYDAVATRLDRRAMAAATNVFTNSKFTAANLQKAYGLDCDVIAPGVDVRRFSPDGRAERRGFIAVGALDRSKGADIVVEALAILPPRLREPLVLVNNRRDPRFVKHLIDLAARLDVKLTIANDMSDNDLVRCYRSARAVVCAAKDEPFGLTIPEAAACGTPAIAFRQGGYLETVVDGVTGWLVEPTPEGLAVAMFDVVSGRRSVDPADVVRQTAARWSWSSCVEALESRCIELAG